jgi:peroxiredoxin Q/BCP
MKTRWLMSLVLLGSLGFGSGMTNAETAIGDQVPDFALIGSDGKTYSSKQFKGKKAFVIAWYPKAFTGG